MPFWDFISGFGKPNKNTLLPKLAAMRLHFIFLPENAAIPIGEDVPSEEMIAAIDRQVDNLVAMTVFVPLTYKENGREILPVFTAEERMQEFAQSRPPIWDYDSGEAFSLNGVGQDGSDALAYLRDCFDREIVVLLDARTKQEIELTRADVETALRSKE